MRGSKDETSINSYLCLTKNWHKNQ